jgi:hypothetical protein
MVLVYFRQRTNTSLINPFVVIVKKGKGALVIVGSGIKPIRNE